MTSITQQIPNYVGGISQQPDELKVPGQVRTAKNVLPDVTHGLLKRPGGRLIGDALSAYTTDSKWFHYYRDENEQYIGQIQLSSGEIKMWRCCEMTINGTTHAAGSSVNVNYESGQATALKNYLKQTNTSGTITDADIQTLTLNDYTYLTNRNKPAAMAATVETVRPPEAYIELKKIAYASQYSVNLFDDTTTEEVYTATRIDVDREIDSSNACASDGSFPSSGSLPGSTGSTRCNKSSGTNFTNDDDMNPNVGTKIFSVDHNTAGNAADANNTAHTYTVTPNGGTASERKNLYFRITTTGQSVPQGNETSPEYISRYTTTLDLLYGGEGWRTGDIFYVWLKNAKYKITIAAHSVSKVQANLGLIRPEPTSFDTKTVVTAESILGAIRQQIVNDTATGNNFTDNGVDQIGNGIYIKRNSGVSSDSFQINTPVGDLLNVFTNSVKDVADLPSQCKHGYVVKVANSEAEEDDYYVKFIGKLKTGGTEGNDNDYLDGEGVWEECPEPGVRTTLDPATLPIQLVRQADGTFKVSQIDWEKRLVGDTTTVPEPSFIKTSDGEPKSNSNTYVGTINKMLFFRNRLVMLSDENVIMSRPGDFYNFWPKSAITYTASDNIDISCSSEYPAIVYDGLQVNSGLVLFTKNQQFMLTTDSDVLSPLTAKINSLSSYNFNFNTNPVSLGTTVAFLDNAGKYTRFFEMTAVLREGEPNVLEQSKNISKLFPNNIDLIANSRENSTIFFATKGTKKLYGFRYYSTGERRVQQAWFEWKLSGNIQHIAMLDDALYAVAKNSSTYTMQKFSIKLDDNSHTIVEDDTYRVHLDNSKTFPHTSLTYVADGHYTKFDHTAANFSSSRQLYAVAVSTGSDKDFNGLLSKVTTFDDNGTTKVKLPGNWTTTDNNKAFNVVLGYDFDMEVEFPTIYVGQREGESYRSDVQASLILQRTKLNLGPSGVYKVTLKRIGKPDYSETYESVKADTYTANTAGIDGEQVVNIPIYEKNTNLTLLLNSKHPSPATLYSMNWEGNYSNRYYRRV